MSVRCHSQSAQIRVSQSADRGSCTLMHAHIRIANRIFGTDIKFGVMYVIFINAICAAEMHRAAAIRAAHTFHARYIESFSLVLF